MRPGRPAPRCSAPRHPWSVPVPGSLPPTVPTLRRRAWPPGAGPGSRRRFRRSGWRTTEAGFPPRQRWMPRWRFRCVAAPTTGRRPARCHCPPRPETPSTGSAVRATRDVLTSRSIDSRGDPAASAHRGAVRISGATRLRLARVTRPPHRLRSPVPVAGCGTGSGDSDLDAPRCADQCLPGLPSAGRLAGGGRDGQTPRIR